MKKHTPTETRYHIHRLQSVGIVMVFMICWGLLQNSIHDPLHREDTISNYRITLWLDAWPLFIFAAMCASSTLILAWSILTNRGLRWSSLVMTPLLLVLLSLLHFGNDDAVGWLLLFIPGAIAIALVHRFFVRRHYRMTYDFGAVTLYCIGMVAFLTVIGPMFWGLVLERHIKTVHLLDETYHLAEVTDWSYSTVYWDHEYNADTQEWIYVPRQEFALFQCENHYSNCAIVHIGRVPVADVHTLDLMVDGESVKISYSGGSILHDPNDQ